MNEEEVRNKEGKKENRKKEKSEKAICHQRLFQGLVVSHDNHKCWKNWTTVLVELSAVNNNGPVFGSENFCNLLQC